ncbi:MAG: hypothetical protein HY560_01190 [Gemmatimonadetes bacterium]|nr:hypothetical protein [Gemmatimonadota bacterium]
MLLIGDALVACSGDAVTGTTAALFATISTGRLHTCGVTTAGAAYCWGSNAHGQFGNGTTTGPQDCQGYACSSTPVAVSGGLRFLAVSAGSEHTCGVTPAGAASCWGFNYLGELGNGTTTNSTTPVRVSNGLTFTTVDAGTSASGGGDHTCGVTPAKVVYCWGDNGYGELGSGTPTKSTTPVVVSGGLTFTAVSAGGYHTCGITSTGAAYCWGLNGSGQLGNGDSTESPTPVPVSGGLAFAAVSAGDNHTCGITSAGTTYCWGYNANGQVGNGDSTGSGSPIPVPVSGGITFTAVSAGGLHTCGITSAGMAYCWGSNFHGQLGDGGTVASSFTPIAVFGGLSFAAIATGGLHTCGVTTSGAAYCWGYNYYGQLGDGSTNPSGVPVRVAQ